jgi:prevent-host-death family protein
MSTKLIASTEAQNNFGRVLDDVVQNSTRYIIRRRNSSQAVILSIADFERILAADEMDRQKFGELLRELRPGYAMGEAISED